MLPGGLQSPLLPRMLFAFQQLPGSQHSFTELDHETNKQKTNKQTNYIHLCNNLKGYAPSPALKFCHCGTADFLFVFKD